MRDDEWAVIIADISDIRSPGIPVGKIMLYIGVIFYSKTPEQSDILLEIIQIILYLYTEQTTLVVCNKKEEISLKMKERKSLRTIVKW